MDDEGFGGPPKPSGSDLAADSITRDPAMGPGSSTLCVNNGGCREAVAGRDLGCVRRCGVASGTSAFDF